jgi:hypothetical protein
MTDADYTAILRWYRNKAAKVIADYVIPTLKRCEADGLWGKGESRKVKAALNKTHREVTQLAAVGARELYPSGFAYIDVEFGRFENAPKYVDSARVAAVGYDPQTSIRGQFAAWCETFAPIAELVARLDAERPKPAYVFAAVSPTVFANVAQAMGVQFSTVRQPEIVHEKVTIEIGGKSVTMWMARAIWPEGTRHNVSRFSWGSRAGNDQCQACGHAIRNGRNWVPLLVDTAEGPASLWVGKDCAETCFGAKIVGDGAFDKPAQ